MNFLTLRVLWYIVYYLLVLLFFNWTSKNINQSNLSNHNSREEEKQVSQGGIERLKMLTPDLRSAAKRARPIRDWFRFCSWLVKRVARAFSTNHRVLRGKTNTIPDYLRNSPENCFKSLPLLSLIIPPRSGSWDRRPWPRQGGFVSKQELISISPSKFPILLICPFYRCRTEWIEFPTYVDIK